MNPNSVVQNAIRIFGSSSSAVVAARAIQHEDLQPDEGGLMSLPALLSNGQSGNLRLPPSEVSRTSLNLSVDASGYLEIVRGAAEQRHRILRVDLGVYSMAASHLSIAVDSQKLSTTLENDLQAFAFRYYGAISAENQEIQAQLAKELKACEEEAALQNSNLYYGLFGCHVERETQGAVKFRRLAASNGLAGKAIAAASGIKNIQVQDVYRIENTPLMQQFQKSTSKFSTTQLKGLFCAIPANTLERIVLYGFGQSGLTKDDLFPVTWDSDSEQYVDDVLKQCREVKLPWMFSRTNPLEYARPQSGDLVFLLLCRVMIANVLVQSQPPTSAVPGYDCVLCNEEYHIFNSAHILPEFVLHCRYIQPPSVASRPVVDEPGPLLLEPGHIARERLLRTAAVRVAASVSELRKLWDNQSRHIVDARRSAFQALRAECTRLKEELSLAKKRTDQLKKDIAASEIPVRPPTASAGVSAPTGTGAPTTTSMTRQSSFVDHLKRAVMSAR